MFSTVISSRLVFYQNLRLQLSKSFSNLLKFASISQTTSFFILALHTLQIIGLTWAQKSKSFSHDTFYHIIYVISTIIRGDAQSIKDLFGSSLIPKLAFYFLSAIAIFLFILIVHEIYISGKENLRKSQFQIFLTKIAGFLYVSAPWILYTPVLNLSLAFLHCGNNSPAGQCTEISRWLNLTLSVVVIIIITAFSWINLYLQFTPYYIVKNNLSSQEMRTRYIRYLHLTISSIILQSPDRSDSSNYALFVINILAGVISLAGIVKRFEFINLRLSYFYSLIIPVYLYTAILGFLDFLEVGQNVTYSVLYLVGGGCVASVARVINKRLMDQILLLQIDKLETSRHLDNICRLLWHYLDISTKDPKASILYISYMRNHLQCCEDISCFCKKCNVRMEEYEANKYGEATKFDIDPKISHEFLEGFIAYWYEKGVKEKFPKDFDLFVSYVNFITEVQKNFIMAWLSTTDRKKKKISIREELLLMSIKGNIEGKILHNLSDDEYNHHAFYTLALDSENKLKDVRFKMTEALKEYISLFQALDREQLDLSVIQKNCMKVSKLTKDVEKELEKLAQLTEFSSLEVKAYYLYFMDSIVGNPVKKKFQAERDRFKRAGSNLDDYFKDNIGVVLLSLQKDKLGHIENSTRGFTNMLGYNIAELKQKNISALMPSQFGQRHTKIMERFLAYSKDFKTNHESFLSFAQNKSQYVVPLTIRVRIETLGEHVYLTGFCDGANIHRCFVLLNNTGRTASFTQNFFTTTQTLGKVSLEELSSIHIKCFMPNLIEFFDNKQDDDLIYQDSFLVLPKDSEALESIKTLPNWIEEKDGGKYASLKEKFLEILKAERIALFNVKFNLTKVVYPRSKITIRLVEILHFSKVKDIREFIDEKDEESPSIDRYPELENSQGKPTRTEYSTLGEGLKLGSQTVNEFHIQTNNEFMFSKERVATQSIIALPENFDFQDTEEPFLEVNNMDYKFIETLPDRLQTVMAPSPKNTRNPSTPKSPEPIGNFRDEAVDQEMTTFSSMVKKSKKKEKSFKWKKVEMGISQHLSKQEIDLRGRSSQDNFGFNAKTFQKVKDMMETQLLIPSLNDDKKTNTDEKRRTLFEQKDGLSVQVENSKIKADSDAEEDDKTTHVKDAFRVSNSMNKQDVLQSIISSKLPFFIRVLRLLGVFCFLLLIAICCINFGIIYHKINYLQEQCQLGGATAALYDAAGVLMKQIQKKLMYLDGVIAPAIWNGYYLPYFQYIIQYCYTVFHKVFDMTPFYYDYISQRFSTATVDLYSIDPAGDVKTQGFENLGTLRYELTQMYDVTTLPDDSYWKISTPAIYFFQKNFPILSASAIVNHDYGAVFVSKSVDEINSFDLAQLSINLFISGLTLLLILPISYTIQRKVNDILSLFRVVPQHEISERLNFYESQLQEFEKLITHEDAYQERFEKLKKERGRPPKNIVKEKAQTQKRKQVKNLLSPIFYSVLVILITWGIILCFLIIGHLKLSSFLNKAEPSYMVVDTCRGIQTFYPNYLGAYYLHLYSEISTDTSGLITATDKAYQEASVAALGNIVNGYIKDLQAQITEYISKGYSQEGNEDLQNIVDAIRNSDMCKVLELSALEKLLCENALFVSNAKSLLAVLQQSFSVLTGQLEVFEINNHDPVLITAFLNSDIFAQNDGMQLIIDKMLQVSVDTFLNEMDSNVDYIKRILIMCLVLNIIVYLGVIWIVWLPYLSRMTTSLLTARQSLLLLPIETISNNKSILGYFYKEGILKR